MARETKKVIKYGRTQITNSVGVETLYTMLDDMTLYRIVGNLMIFFQSNAGAHTIQFMIRPSAVSLKSPIVPATGDELDGSDAFANLWNYVGYAHGTQQYDILPFDIKARRKLNEGDLLVFQHISPVASNADIYYSLTLFFLEE